MICGSGLPPLQEEDVLVFSHCTQSWALPQRETKNRTLIPKSEVLQCPALPGFPAWKRQKKMTYKRQNLAGDHAVGLQRIRRHRWSHKVFVARAEVSWQEKPGAPAQPRVWASLLATGQWLPGRYLLPAALKSWEKMGQTAEIYPSGTQLCCLVDPREMKNINQKSKRKKKSAPSRAPN